MAAVQLKMEVKHIYHLNIRRCVAPCCLLTQRATQVQHRCRKQHPAFRVKDKWTEIFLHLQVSCVYSALLLLLLFLLYPAGARLSRDLDFIRCCINKAE